LLSLIGAEGFENSVFDAENGGVSLPCAKACAIFIDDREFGDLLTGWARLNAKQRRQVVALVGSMAD
jgi:hypothetical protein